MGLDRRVRDELRQQADQVETDSVQALGSVTRRAEGGRRPTARLGIAAAAVAVVAVLIRLVAVGPQLSTTPGSSPTPGHSPSASPAQGQTVALVGSWTVSLAPGDQGVDALGMSGTWTMGLGEDATIDLFPPDTFAPPSGRRPTGYIHAEDGPSFLTTLFARDYAAPCAGSGRYTWVISGDRMSFTTVEDTCEARRTLLTTRPWSLAPAPLP